MKKLGVLLVLGLLVIVPLVLHVVIAQDEVPGLPGVLTPEGVGELQEQLKNQSDTGRWVYLAQQWRAILDGNPATSFILKVLDGISSIFLGVVFQLFSLAYIIRIFLFALIIIISYGFFEGFFEKKIFSIPGSFVVASLAVRFIPDSIFDLQGKLIWKAGFLIILMILIYFSLAFEGYFKKQSEKEKEERLKQRQKILSGLYKKEIQDYSGKK